MFLTINVKHDGEDFTKWQEVKKTHKLYKMFEKRGRLSIDNKGLVKPEDVIVSETTNNQEEKPKATVQSQWNKKKEEKKKDKKEETPNIDVNVDDGDIIG